MRLSVCLAGLIALAWTPAAGAQTVQQAYLKASDAAANAQFGMSVAVSGNTAVVGTPNAGVGGAAYVFVRNGAAWSQQALLKASNFEAFDSFGTAVAISGDTIVVGASNEDSAATGVGGNQADNSANLSGAAYVFVRNGTSWSQQAYLKASNTGVNDLFGYRVAISGDTLVVTAIEEDSAAAGIDGNQSDNSASRAGAAYVFVRSGGLWSQQAYVKASNPGVADDFGCAAALSGDTLAVGAWREDSAATGLDGDQGSNASPDSGATYIFVRSGGTWSQQAYVKASNTGPDNFGFGVGLSGDTLAVGALSEDSNATGVGGNEANNAAAQAGAAYVFLRTGSTWAQQAYVKASNTEGGDLFGTFVAVSDDVLVVGSANEDSNATGVNGSQANNAALGSGAAYVFARNGATWAQQAYVKASNTGSNDGFAIFMACEGDALLVGAYEEDSSATSVNGNQTLNDATSAGAAYAFDLDLDRWTDLGFGLAGVGGVPYFAGTGSLVAGSTGVLALVNGKPNALCTLHVSVGATPVPFKGGMLAAFPPILNIPLFVGADGKITLPFLWPSGLPSGTGICLQYSIADSGAPNNVSLSNALLGTTP